MPDWAAWDLNMVKDIKLIESVQRQAACFVRSKYTGEEGAVTHILHSVSWPMLKARRKCHRLELCYELPKSSSTLTIPNYLDVPSHVYNARSHASCRNHHTKGQGNIYVSEQFFPQNS